MADRKTNLLRGTVDLLILKALSLGSKHGYGVSEWVEAVTDGEILMEKGTLYPALRRLEGKGWIAAEWGRSENNRRARFYRLTVDGRSHLERESGEWSRLSSAMDKALTVGMPDP